MPKSWLLSGLFLASLAAPVVAQEQSTFNLGGDQFQSGRTVVSSEPVSGDYFGAGSRVTVAGDIGGAAHLAGRRIVVSEPVAGSLYAMGYSIDIAAPIGGNATLAGAEILVSGEISGNLRATADQLTIDDPVAGSALIAAADVMLQAAISGDVVMAVDAVQFGDNARVDGTFTLYTDNAEDVVVPETVASSDRVTVLEADEHSMNLPEEMQDMGQRSLMAGVRSFLMGVLLVAVVAALAVGIAPERVANMRATALARPGRSVLIGFVTLSALIGSAIVLAFTLVGLLLMPAAILLSVLAVLAGYVAGAYVLGVGLWSAFGREIPVSTAQKAGLALLGAFVAGLVALIPIIGWLAWMLLMFAGLGAMALATFGKGPAAT